MIKIAEAFKGKMALIACLMAGDPDLETSAEYILTAQESGAGLIEIGIPFSDPVAEGEILQAANMRALSAGTRLDSVFNMIASIKDNMRIPMIFTTYLNPVYVYGCDAFFARCEDIGISGVIIPDMPFEEQGEVEKQASKYGVEIVTLIAPTSQNRVTKIARNAEGFIHLVSSTGVTGGSNEGNTGLSQIIAEIRKVTNVPIALDFEALEIGESGHYSNSVNGVIVGSDIVKIIARHGKDAKQALREYFSGLRIE